MRADPAIFGAIGVVVTIVALAVAAYQVYQANEQAKRATSVAEAASAAAVQALNETRQRYNQHLISHAFSLCRQAAMHVGHQELNLAAIRLNDLAYLLRQIADADPVWESLADRLQAMDDQFNRIVQRSGKFPANLHIKWFDLQRDLEAKLGHNLGLFRIDQKGE